MIPFSTKGGYKEIYLHCPATMDNFLYSLNFPHPAIAFFTKYQLHTNIHSADKKQFMQIALPVANTE